ncbi:MAG: C40 family peptidase [Ignavibacteriales bacterium]|nr:C40 family peptidase [Ignavibacteriales bacterium]
MKKTILIRIALVLVLCALTASAQTQKVDTPASVALDSLRARYAPDKRVAVFDVTYAQQGSLAIARGEVDDQKAKEDALSTLHTILGGQVIDSIKVLPDQQLGEKRFGIVAASVGNVRTHPRHSAELATQVLMGTAVKLLKKQGGHYSVQMPDHYIGWLEEAAMKVTTAAGVEEWNAAQKVIVTTYFTMVREKPDPASVPVSDAVAGVLMKRVGASGKWDKVELPDGRKGYIEKSNVEDFKSWKKSRKLSAENVEKTAKMFIGIPYLWGGTSTKGMDCSGFTKTVYRLNGLELYRDADQQAGAGDEVKPGENFENLKKGDLLFFGRKGAADKPERISHVAIFLEKQEFIHTPGGSWVKFNSFNPAALNYSESLRKSFVRARRYVGTSQIPEVPKK